MTDELRRTGRTTKMLREALEALRGDPGGQAHFAYIVMFARELSQAKSTMRSLGAGRGEMQRFLWRGASDRSLGQGESVAHRAFIDHSVTEEIRERGNETVGGNVGKLLGRIEAASHA